jgi:thymidylate synthase ThyX
MWSHQIGVDDLIKEPSSLHIGDVLSFHAEQAYPMMVTPRTRPAQTIGGYGAISQVVAPETDEEKWVSMFMVGSRGFSHENVRHRFRTSVSQRSTRFVAENESPWVDHPLVQEYLKSADGSNHDLFKKEAGFVQRDVEEVKRIAKETYDRVSTVLQAWLIEKGVDKFTARKQARGAARGYLGNALLTELIFSASVGQWKRMLRMRACAAADAEIREAFIQALEALKASRYADDFKAFEVEAAKDGLGQVAVEKK